MAQDLNDFHGRPLSNGPLDRKPAMSRADDFGQADYSTTYGYDPQTRTGYRTDAQAVDAEVAAEPRTFAERGKRRAGVSDRVLWAVIVERLEDERRIDLSEVQVLVQDGEVTLNGTVKHKGDKRRIEDIADIEGIDNVQNNLRVREKRGLF